MNASPEQAATPLRQTRRKWLIGFGAAVAVAATAYASYYALVLSHYESTDNAYVQGNVVQITPQVGGTVVAIGADDTDFVRAGQTLVKLDRIDAQVALEQAEAQLAQTVREVRVLYANNGTLGAQIALREAELARAQSDLSKAEDDAQRRAALTQSGAVSAEEFKHAQSQLSAVRSNVAAAQAALVSARQQLASNQTLTAGTNVDQHPNVMRAAARVHEAYIALNRSVLPAPVDGYIAKRGVQLGQKVAAGSPLMSVVPLKDVWVDANFKESQLRQLRIGQTVQLEADVYGKKIEYHGKVAGLGAGTGSAFSLLPAQNATGNWIKIVQRVPVRIELDPAELSEHPLRVGLSMDVTVDVSRQDGKILADAPRPKFFASTEVFDSLERDADLRVRDIIASNNVLTTHADARPRPVTALVKTSPAGAAAVSAD
ncbi:HlyD family efflux transporter periplasmic adaptor subunit [Burkholderiaceae bacterium UC74_6]